MIKNDSSTTSLHDQAEMTTYYQVVIVLQVNELFKYVFKEEPNFFLEVVTDKNILSI